MEDLLWYCWYASDKADLAKRVRLFWEKEIERLCTFGRPQPTIAFVCRLDLIATIHKNRVWLECSDCIMVYIILGDLFLIAKTRHGFHVGCRSSKSHPGRRSLLYLFQGFEASIRDTTFGIGVYAE